MTQYPLKRLHSGGYKTLDGSFNVWPHMDGPGYELSAETGAAYQALGEPDFAPLFEFLSDVRGDLFEIWPVGRGPIPKNHIQILTLCAKADHETRTQGTNLYFCKISNRALDWLIKRDLATLGDDHRSVFITENGRLALKSACQLAELPIPEIVS